MTFEVYLYVLEERTERGFLAVYVALAIIFGR